MKNYFSGNQFTVRPGRMQVREHDIEEDWEWTPCRYSTSGWKYQKKGTTQAHLNHFNKLNVYGTDGSMENLKRSFNI